jgi:hypothetical protein
MYFVMVDIPIDGSRREVYVYRTREHLINTFKSAYTFDIKRKKWWLV